MVMALIGLDCCLFFIHELLQHWIATREEKSCNSFFDKLLVGLAFVFLIFSLPIFGVSYWLRDIRQKDREIRAKLYR